TYLTSVLPAAMSSALATLTAFQTVPAFFQHFFRSDADFNPQPLIDLPSLATLSTLLTAVLLLTVTLTRARRIGLRRALSAASVLSVVLMPQAEQYHFLALFAPFGLAAMPLESLNRAAGIALLLALLCVYAPLPYKDAALASGLWSLLAYP